MAQAGSFMGFDQPLRALIVGARGGIGRALASAILAERPRAQLWVTSRDPAALAPALRQHPQVECVALDLVDEDSLLALGARLDERAFKPNLVLNASGLLHRGESLQPERSWRQLRLETMRRVFEVNTFGVALLARELLPRMARSERAVFASISARLASIGDNRLGGWYSYRASKTAQHQLIKTLSIEAARSRKQLICVSLHPGTVDSELSAPFQRSVPPGKLFTPDQSAAYLAEVIAQLRPSDSGNAFAWDGQQMPW